MTFASTPVFIAALALLVAAASDARGQERPRSKPALPVSEEEASATPAAEEPAFDQPASETATEEPASEETPGEKPPSDQPVSDQPASEQPASETATSEEPASEGTAVEDPPSDEPAPEETASEDSASDEPESKEPTERELFVADLCERIEAEASAQSLPEAFFARLIWAESRFDPNAVSPKGAQGIAQFMPATARERGLEDPFDPPSALAKSAEFLAELRDTFGNVGLAAAGYNAGPDRVGAWLAGLSGLPWETRGFVRTITGMTADAWTEPDVETPSFALHDTLPFQEACRDFARHAVRLASRAGAITPTLQPWGVLIASHHSHPAAEAAFERQKRRFEVIASHEPIDIARRPNRSRGGRLWYEYMLGAKDRGEASALCDRLRRAGGSCLVVRN